MPHEEDRKWLYAQFKDNGYDTGSYEDFVKSLDNDEDFEWWHGEAASLGLEVGDLNEFGELFRTPKGGSGTKSVPEPSVDAPDNFDDEPNIGAIKDERRKKTAEAVQGKEMFDEMRQKKGVKSVSERISEPKAQKTTTSAPVSSVSGHLEQKKADEERYGGGGKGYSASEAVETGREYEEIVAENDALNKDVERYNKTGQGDYAELKDRERALKEKTDRLTSSPAWKEYLDLSDRYKTLSEATETPEIRLEKARLASELGRNPIARAGMGAEAPSESQIRFDENRAEADFIESQMETADRAKRKEYKERLKELNREVLDNDYYQADVARRIQENEASLEDIYGRMNEIRENTLKNKSKLETLDEALLAEPEYQKLKLAANQLEQAGRKLSHIRDKNAGDFWVNFMDVFSDPNTYNFGITNLETALAAKAATIQNGTDYMKPVNDGSVDLLSAVVGANEVSAEEGKYVVGKGKYGQIAAQSIPFMFQIGLTGGFGNVANAVSGRVTKALGDKFLTRTLGAVLGDLSAGFFAANTIGGAKTMTDILNNYYGTLTRDENGRYGYEGGMNLAKATWKGEVGNIIEYASERAGDHMQNLLGRAILTKGKGFVSSGAAKAAFMEGKVGNVSLTRETLADMMGVTLKEFGFRSSNKAGANWAQKAMSGFLKTMDKMGVQGFPFEVAEEYVGLLGNVILGGEEKWMDFSSLGDKETHTDIWGGMLYSIGLTQAGAVSVGAGGAAVNGIRKAATYQAIQGALEAGNALGREVLGDEWESIKETIDGTDNKELPKKVAEYMDNGMYSPLQREAILDYVKNTYLSRGFNAGTLAQARERIMGDENLLSLNINAEVASAQDQISDAYMLGYQNAPGPDAGAIDSLERRDEMERAVNRQKARFSQMTGIENITEEEANAILADGSRDPEMRDAALDYLMALAVERGFNDAERNKALAGRAAIEGAMLNRYGKFYYEDPFGERTVETSQWVNPATGKPENIFILSGEPNADGKVPFVSTSGRKGYVSREEVADFDGNGNVVPGLTNTQSLNDFLDAQYAYEQTRREGDLAAADAEKTAERQAAETRQAQTDNRALVEGMEGADGSFTYNGQKGRLIRKTDEGAVFEPEDGSDNVALTWEELAQSAQPAEEPVEETEEEETEEEKPKIPTDKDGNPIYDAPGVSVEDALADMYSTEGLDEADVDDYIIGRANEAEKGRAVKQGKMSLKEWGQAKKEANRVADFWGELKKYAEENKADREKAAKEEAERQAIMDKYGFDIRNFDMNPQTLQEATAEYLGGLKKGINLEDAIRETLGRRKDGKIPTEIFRHLGAHGILTKTGGLSIQDTAKDIVREFYGDIEHDYLEEDVRNYIIDFLLNNTKGEIRDFILNERLRQAREEADEAERRRAAEEEAKKGAGNPPAVKEGGTPPANTGTKEGGEGNPPSAPAVPVGERPEGTPPQGGAPAGQAPEGQVPEGQGNQGGNNGANNGGNAGNNGGNSVPLGEGEKGGETKAGGETKEGGNEGGVPPTAEGPKEEGGYGAGNKIVTKERAEELRKKILGKLGGQLNAGFDPEIFAWGVELAAYHIEAGARKFVDFAKKMIEGLTDAIRPYLKGIYNGARDLPGMEEIRKDMDSADYVEKIDVNADFNALADEQDDADNQLRDTGGSAGDETPEGGVGENGGEAPGNGAEPGNTGDDNPSEPVGGNGEGAEGGDNGVESGGGEPGAGESEGGEVVAGETEEGDDGSNRGGQGRGRSSGGNRTGRGGKGGRRGTRKNNGESKSGEEKGEGETEAGEEGTDVPVSGGEDIEQKPGLSPEAQYAKEEQDAFEKESERLKDEEDTDKLKNLKNQLQEKIDAIKDRLDLVRAKLSGQLRAVLARLKDVFSASAKKAAQLAQEKIPYKSVADETGAHDLGNTVVPSGAGDSMRNAIKRVEKAVGKPVADFVMEELGYKSKDEMFKGLSSEQVDALGLAVYQMKTGRMFIVGDMTGVGKGRTAAGLIRWGLLHGKKVLFATQTPDLFSSMYEDLEDIGSKGMVPWIVNEDAKANIQKVDENDVSHVIVRHPGEEAAQALYTSGKDTLPIVKRDSRNNGKRYQFVMTTYSQLYAGAEEKEGDSEKVKKLNQRQEWGRMKAQWLKLYAKDAIVIMDESHNASGNSSRGNVFRDMVADAAGVTFLSATYAKRPQNMAIYALRSSMGDAMVSQQQMIQAIMDYGVPMQEMLASALFETGEMVRRERDATGMHTHWLKPNEIYSEEELKRSRQMFDRTVEMVNKIIKFQRTYVNPIIDKKNKDVSGKNMGEIMAMLSGATDDAYVEKYASTQYSSQVSRLTRAVMLAIKAKKAAELAVQQIKDGNKPVIAIDETLETELKQLKKELGEDENADMAPDFGRILQKAIDFSLRYQHSTDHYKKVWNEKKEQYVPKKLPADRQVEKFSTIESEFDEEGMAALAALREEVEGYGKEMLDMDLTLSPIDQMRRHITEAGYKVEEITGRKSRFVKKEDGKWAIEPMKVDKPRFRNKFNGGRASNPVPEEERLDCLIINRSGATGTNLHSSKAFGDQKPRKMIIVEPAQNVDEEVQVRGRIDRTGQVHRGEYFYLVSPIPIESRFLMSLRRKLASLDASAVGTDKVSTNKVDVEDMENKYGDEIAKDFLSEHEEINDQMDRPIAQDRKTKKWIGRPNLMSDLLKAIQRMTCDEQEVTLQEISEMYADKMEYLSQNGINDMTSVTMDLEAETIDKAVIVKGKNNKSVSVFAHDTTIERVEVNNLSKPILSADIEAYLKSVGAMTEDGKIDTDYGNRVSQKALEAKNAILAEKRRKYDEALADYEANIRETFPQPDDMSDTEYENEVKAKVDAKRNSLEDAYANDQRRLESQRRTVGYAAMYLKPGRPYLVPLNESKGAETRYGRFLGFETGKDGRASSVKAVFAVRDSRGMVSFPVASMHEIIEAMVNSTSGVFGDLFGKRDSDYASKEEQMAEWNTWWDRMTPKSNRMHRFMITGNILQAIGSLTGHRGAMVTFTRRDKETGEISIERGLLLAEDFDPDTFMVRTHVTKEDVWNAAGELADDITRITVYRDGDTMVVKYKRENKDEKLSASPLLKDEELNKLCERPFEPRGVDELQAVVSEGNVQKVLDQLYENYNFTIGTLLVMPDSTDKPDRIVYTNKPYAEVINEIGPMFPRVHDDDDADREVKNLLAQYKRDVTNEDIKERIGKLVQLRQAYIRKRYGALDDGNLAWRAIISMSEYNKWAKPVPGETPEQAKARKESMREAYNLAEAYKEELLSRGSKKGTALHFKQGKVEIAEMEKTFNQLNSDKQVARIAKKVFAIAKQIPRFEIFMNERTDTEIGGYTAGEAMSFNWNFMNDEIIPDQMKASTIVHELLHTATVYVYRLAIELNNDVILQAGMGDIITELQSIFNAIRNNNVFRHQFGKYSWETYTDYGVTNTKEMLSEAGANPQFQELLSKVTLAVNARSGMITFTDVTGKDYTGKTQTALEAIMERLDIILDSFDLNAFNQAWTGTGYGGRSQYFRRAENLRNPIDRAKAITTIDGIAKKLGVQFEQDSSLKAKGSFDPKTGKIRINIDAHRDTADLEATLLHEAVAHYGLRKLFGKDWTALRRQLYDKADPIIKARVDAIAKAHNLSTEVAMEEYIASLAEDGRFDGQEESFWQRLVTELKRLLAKLGINAGYFNDEDFRAMLYASYRNFQTGGALETAARVATAAALRRNAEASHEDEGPDDGGPEGGSSEKRRIREQTINNGTFMKAPNGQPTRLTEDQWLTVRTKAFKDWFGDWENDPLNASKAVDENGEPLVVWRVGKTDGYSVFDENKGGNWRGFYFTNRDAALQNYATNETNESQLRAFFLNSRNPDTSNNFNVLQGDKKELSDLGYDGMIYSPEGIDARNFEVKVFDSNQIKSATDNNGNFSTEDPDIYHRFLGEEGARNLDASGSKSAYLTIAKMMEKNGFDAKRIKMATGWERGADGKWRYEVPDDITVKPGVFDKIIELVDKNEYRKSDLLYHNYDMEELFDAPELYKAYPKMRKYKIRILDMSDGKWGSSWGGAIDLNYRLFTSQMKEYGFKTMLDVVSHEVQHEIQNIEGFAYGSWQDDYWFRTGEVEARNAARRRDMSAEEIAQSLGEETEDILRSRQSITPRTVWNAASEEFEDAPMDFREDMDDIDIDRETGELYRRSEGYAVAKTADDMYDRRTSTVGSALYASQVDEYAPADALQESIYRERFGDGKKLPEKDRLSNRLRELGGQAMNETRKYVEEFMRPMWKAIATFRKNAKGADGKKMTQKDFVRYVGLKSGLERNVLFAKRDAKRDYQKEYDARIDELKARLKEGKAKLDRQLRDGDISDVTYQAKLTELNRNINVKMDEAEARRKAKFAEVDLGDSGNDARYKQYRKKDYSAIMTWFNKGNDLERRKYPSRKAYNRAVLALRDEYVDGVSDLASAEEAAHRIVDDAERRAGREAVSELWRRINAATKETLDFQYGHNMISGQQRADIAASMHYYVPMRGFEDNTAEDFYSYYMKPNNAGFAPTILAAKGRTTRYDNPFGMIGFMHSSAVSQGLKNEAKLTLLDFVRKYPKNTLATITRAWFVQTGDLDEAGNPVYEVAYPDIPEGATAQERESAVKEFEERMDERKAKGEAYNSHREVRMNGGVVAFEKEAHKNEHVVKVNENGKEYGILVNGNPAAAQAINGIKRQGGYENFLEILRVTRRVLSSMFTTLSVPFWVSNFQRDQGEGLATTFTRNSLGYTGGYILNRWKILPQMLPLVMGRSEKGGMMDKLSPELAEYYRMYVENGGPMGQNRIENDSYFVRQMNRYIALQSLEKAHVAKGAAALFQTIASLGEAVETVTRFSTFVTSMQYGRSLHEAIADSKEVSTNFARKGHGRSISWEETARLETRGGRQLGDNSLGWFTEARNYTDRALIVAGTAVLELLRAGIPFFNASVQGIYKKVKNYQADWVKAVLVDGVYLAIGFAMRMMGGGGYGGDDDKEKYGHTSDYTRRNNLLMSLGDGRYHKWALPQEYRYMFALGDIAAEAMLEQKPLDDLAIDAYEAFAQILPAGAVDPSAHGQAFWIDALKSVMPGAVTPIVEAFENRDFKGSRIYNEGYNGNAEFDPGWTKAIETTGEGYVKAAEWLNKVTGGGEENAAIRGKIDINPAIVEHFVKSYLSGPYQIVGGVGALVGKASRGEDIVTRDIPIWNRVMMNTNDNSRDAYYSAMYYYFKDRDKEAARLEAKMKGHTTKQYDEFRHSKDYAYMMIFKKYESNERAMNKMRKQALDAGNTEAVRRVDEMIADARTGIANECLDVYFDRVDWKSWLGKSNNTSGD